MEELFNLRDIFWYLEYSKYFKYLEYSKYFNNLEEENRIY